MLRDFVGTRTSGLLFHTSTDNQLLQANTLQDSLHPILKKLKHEKGGFNIIRRYGITQGAEVWMPGSASAHLVGACDAACIRAIHETSRRAGLPCGLGR
jgi:hypothetical protein